MDVRIRFIRFIDDYSMPHKPYESQSIYYCDFKIFPSAANKLIRISTISVRVTEDPYHIESSACVIPEEVRSNLTESIREVVFDFSEFNTSSKIRRVLLADVQVRRLHELDRRQFNVSLCTMVSDLNSPLLVEWLVYNIALGVEHFYIFDNRKIFPPSCNSNSAEGDQHLSNSAIRPFLDANLITLIYYPFSPSSDFWWIMIQRSTFEVMLSQFGPFNKWIGFVDIDEFFLPSVSFRSKRIVDILNEMDSRAGSPSFVLKDPSRESDAAWFNTVEMFCDLNGTIANVTNNRQALTTHCFIEGGRFYQVDIVNGKSSHISFRR